MRFLVRFSTIWLFLLGSILVAPCSASAADGGKAAKEDPGFNADVAVSEALNSFLAGAFQENIFGSCDNSSLANRNSRMSCAITAETGIAAGNAAYCNAQCAPFVASAPLPNMPASLNYPGVSVGNPYKFGGSWNQGNLLVTSGFNSPMPVDPFGPHPAFTCSNSLQQYDQLAFKWATLATMPAAIEGAASAVGSDGKDYIIGGDNCSGTVLGTVYAYTPSTNTWAVMPSLITARDHATAVTGEDGKIYVMGGTGATGTVLSSVEVFTPGAAAWTAGTSMLQARTNASSVLNINGQVVVAGGLNASGADLSEAETLSSTNTWSTIPSLNTARHDFSLNLLHNQRLIGAGGISNGVFQTSTETISPATNTSWTAELDPLPAPRAQMNGFEDGTGNLFLTNGMNSASGVPDSSTVIMPILSNPAAQTVKWFIQGSNASPIFGSLQMNQIAPLPNQAITLSLSLLSTTGWLSSYGLTGAFASGAQFTYTQPCSLGLSLGTISVFTTDIDGNNTSSTPVASNLNLGLCLLSPAVITLPVPSGLTMNRNRFRVVITGIAGVNLSLPAGTTTTFQVSNFLEEQE